MCGLVGIAGDIVSDWKDVFTDLLVIDSLRGMHSTGAAVVRRHKDEVEVCKRVGGPQNLITDTGFKDLTKGPLKAMIGHNRYATLGKHTEENAHPFQFQHVVGAHNGTLDSWSIKKLHNHDKYDTDSQAIYATINEHGIRKTVDQLSGAWALTWFDLRDNTINFLRNDKRPLFYCYSKDRTSLLWASELNMLRFALDRRGREAYDNKVYLVDPDKHLSWKVPTAINEKLESPKITEMAAPKYQAPATNYSYWDAGSQDWRDKQEARRNNVLPFVPARQTQTHQSQTGKRTGMNSTGYFNPNRVNTQKFRPPYKNAEGKIMNKKMFNELVACGCVMCQDANSEWGDFIKPLRDADGQQIYLCEECYNNDEVFDLCCNLM